MKKGGILGLIAGVFLVGGVVSLTLGSADTNAVTPTDYNNIHYNDIKPYMYIGSEATVAYDSFAYLGDTEQSATELFYFTITGMATEDGAQYMPFVTKASNQSEVDAHIEKTYEWEIDGDIDSPPPTGFPINGVVKKLSEEEKTFFLEWFTDSGAFTQEDIDATPELFSDYYIDTTDTGSSPTTNALMTIGISLLFLAFPMALFAIITTYTDKLKTRYAYKNIEHSQAASVANSSLDDEVGTPLGFE